MSLSGKTSKVLRAGGVACGHKQQMKHMLVYKPDSEKLGRF